MIYYTYASIRKGERKGEKKGREAGRVKEMTYFPYYKRKQKNVLGDVSLIYYRFSSFDSSFPKSNSFYSVNGTLL